MTDEPGVDRDAEEQERVRRLLAAARHDEPAPPDVVARLDAALAAEAARRPGPAEAPGPGGDRGPVGTAAVVDLAARRRRRRRTGLLAAAAVVVAGVGLGAVGLDGGLPLDGGGEQSTAGGSAADSGAESDAGASSEAPGAAQRQQEEESAPDVMGARAPLPTVRTGATLAADVTRALRTGEALGADGIRCTPPGVEVGGAGVDVVAVRADGTRAELVASPASGGSREAALYSCAADTDGTADTPLATLTVPAG